MRIPSFTTKGSGTTKVSPNVELNLLASVRASFDVLKLVFTDGNDVRVIEQNISGHQNGIVEEPGIDIELTFF